MKYNMFVSMYVFTNRANPVLNLNIDGAMNLDMDEDSSDVDKVR